MIITIATEKGGDGKSTIATNLAGMMAMSGLDVLLIDSDMQGSSYLWCSVRDENEKLAKITCFQKQGRVRDEIQKVHGKFKHIIIDTPGRKAIESQSSMLVSDLVIVPLAVGYFNAWALRTTEGFIYDAKTVNHDLVVKVALNKASTNVTLHDYAEAAAVLKNFPLLNNLFSTVVHDRRIYRYASGVGKCVLEMEGNDRAKTEMENLYEEVMSHDKDKI